MGRAFFPLPLSMDRGMNYPSTNRVKTWQSWQISIWRCIEKYEICVYLLQTCLRKRNVWLLLYEVTTNNCEWQIVTSSDITRMLSYFLCHFLFIYLFLKQSLKCRYKPLKAKNGLLIFVIFAHFKPVLPNFFTDAFFCNYGCDEKVHFIHLIEKSGSALWRALSAKTF